MPLKLWPAEREALRPPEDLTLSQWAQRHRILSTKNSVDGGPWRNDRAPYQVGIMDALTDPMVEDATCIKATQMGLTEILLNFLAYVIDQDPGPTMLVYPRKEDCAYMRDQRIRELLRTNPRVSRHKTGWKRDDKKDRIGFDRMTVYLGASTSPADVAAKAVRYLLLDELDRFETWLPGEGNPLDLARKRQRTYWNRKTFKLSSPTTPQNNIWQEWLKSDRRRFWCQCPKCHRYQFLVWAQVKWPKEIREPDRIKSGPLASYECQHCGHRIKDGGRERKLFLRSGVWAPEGATVEVSGKVVGAKWTSHAGFHISALYSPWTTWSELAAEWLNAHRRVESLQVFVNTELAEPWEEKAFERTVTELRRWILPYKSGEVPEGEVVLTAGVDVQEDHFYYVVRAWSEKLESWLIEAGRCESWVTLEMDVLNASWGDHQVRLCCIDSGFDPWTVYDYCLKHPGLLRPTKGSSHPMRRLYEATRVEVNKATGRVIPGGLNLWILDTARFKDRILRLQNIPEDQPGGWHLPEDIAEEYLEQLSNEQKVFDRNLEHGRGGYLWRPKWKGAPQHLWDCEVYATAAADMLGVAGGKTVSRKRPQTPEEAHKRPRKPWLEKRRRGTWLDRIR